MKRTFALIVIGAVVASPRADLSVPQTTRGLVVEALHPASAALAADVRAGDDLVWWKRSDATGTVVARGEFRTPFDAREFEIEQLPRGGTSLTLVRDGQTTEVSLIPGFWGVSVRPRYSSADLAIYAAGRALEKEKPEDALTTWQPLIDRATADDDLATAGWLLTQAAAALVAADQVERGDELFDKAAALVRQSATSQRRTASTWVIATTRGDR